MKRSYAFLCGQESIRLIVSLRSIIECASLGYLRKNAGGRREEGWQETTGRRAAEY